MKKQIMYAKNNFKIERFKCFVYDKNLLNICTELYSNKLFDLLYLVYEVLSCKSKLKLSFAIEKLTNYEPTNSSEEYFFKQVLNCILIKESNRKIDPVLYLLNEYYKLSLEEADEFCSDQQFLPEIITKIPYSSNLKRR